MRARGAGATVGSASAASKSGHARCRGWDRAGGSGIEERCAQSRPLRASNATHPECVLQAAQEAHQTGRRGVKVERRDRVLRHAREDQAVHRRERALGGCRAKRRHPRKQRSLRGGCRRVRHANEPKRVD